jgi:hypothetical protein
MEEKPGAQRCRVGVLGRSHGRTREVSAGPFDGRKSAFACSAETSVKRHQIEGRQFHPGVPDIPRLGIYPGRHMLCPSAGGPWLPGQRAGPGHGQTTGKQAMALGAHPLGTQGAPPSACFCCTTSHKPSSLPVGAKPIASRQVLSISERSLRG